MKIALAAFVVLASAPVGAQDDAAADKALAEFEKTWRTKRDDASRTNAITPLTMYRSDKILQSLLEKAELERSNQVKEALLKAIRDYRESEKAIDFLYEQITKNRKMPSVLQTCFEGLGGGKPQLTRKRVGELHEYLKSKYNRDMNVQVPVVKALGGIRHKSSVEPLMERLKKAQTDMREYIKGSNLPNCDGG
jgi:hypothetical protein